jgi:uncharacterized protein YceK
MELTAATIWILKVPVGAVADTVISPVDAFTETKLLLAASSANVE